MVLRLVSSLWLCCSSCSVCGSVKLDELSNSGAPAQQTQHKLASEAPPCLYRKCHQKINDAFIMHFNLLHKEDILSSWGDELKHTDAIQFLFSLHNFVPGPVKYVTEVQG